MAHKIAHDDVNYRATDRRSQLDALHAEIEAMQAKTARLNARADLLVAQEAARFEKAVAARVQTVVDSAKAKATPQAHGFRSVHQRIATDEVTRAKTDDAHDRYLARLARVNQAR